MDNPASKPDGGINIEGIQNIADAAAGSAHQQIQISKEAVKLSLP
jgi:hypothetical protein